MKKTRLHDQPDFDSEAVAAYLLGDFHRLSSEELQWCELALKERAEVIEFARRFTQAAKVRNAKLIGELVATGKVDGEGEHDEYFEQVRICEELVAASAPADVGDIPAPRFLRGDSRQDRELQVRQFIHTDPGIAVVLAAADFEWTVVRAFKLLGRKVSIRSLDQSRLSGPEPMRKMWAKLLVPLGHPSLDRIVDRWDTLCAHFQLRNKLVHGIQSSTASSYASVRVETILGASRAVTNYAASCKVDLFQRVPRRQSRV